VAHLASLYALVLGVPWSRVENVDKHSSSSRSVFGTYLDRVDLKQEPPGVSLIFVAE
jgi:hypothetical protein